jgi:hypothetical protein
VVEAVGAGPTSSRMAMQIQSIDYILFVGNDLPMLIAKQAVKANKYH